MERPGRRTIFETNRITKEKLIEAFKKYKTAKKTSIELKIDYKTVRKYLKHFGIKLKRGTPIREPDETIHSAALIKWIRAHPKKALPRSTTKIAKLTGCTKDEVKTYIYRKRKKVRDFVKDLSDLSKTSIKLRDEIGRIIPFRYFHHYEITFNPWSFKIKLKGFLKPDGNYIVTFPLMTLDQFKELLDENKDE